MLAHILYERQCLLRRPPLHPRLASDQDAAHTMWDGTGVGSVARLRV